LKAGQNSLSIQE